MRQKTAEGVGLRTDDDGLHQTYLSEPEICGHDLFSFILEIVVEMIFN